MTEKVEQVLKTLPEAPGIYQMLDKNGNIIYIGKSKCLKKRVHSYFVPSPVWDKAKQMARFITDLRFIVTDTHLEAMLLECERIKEIKPYFNSMMKNDQKYMFLTLEENNKRNPLKVTHTREALSFGPFRRRGMLEEVIGSLRNLYPLRKNGTKYEFEYHIFPCEMEKEVFLENRKNLKRIFSRKTEMERFVRVIKREMKAAAETQSFERAMYYRNLSEQLAWLQKYLNRFEEWHKTDIVYAVPLNQGCKLFYISDGEIVLAEKADEDTEEARNALIQRVKWMSKQPQKELGKEKSEKALLDYRDIVYAELSAAEEGIYIVE